MSPCAVCVSQAPALFPELSGESWASWENEGLFEYLWLDDARAFAARLSLRERHALRGYSVWVLGFEDPRIWQLPGDVAH